MNYRRMKIKGSMLNSIMINKKTKYQEQIEQKYKQQKHSNKKVIIKFIKACCEISKKRRSHYDEIYQTYLTEHPSAVS